MRALINARIGPCPFTVDANLYNEDEQLSQSRVDLSTLPPLPDRKRALIIAGSFMKNVSDFLFQTTCMALIRT